MGTSFDALKIRSKLGKFTWGPPRPFGPDGWVWHQDQTDEPPASLFDEVA